MYPEITEAMRRGGNVRIPLTPYPIPYDEIWVNRKDFIQAFTDCRDVDFVGKTMFTQDKVMNVRFFDIALSIADVVGEGCMEVCEVEELMLRGVYRDGNRYYTNYLQRDKTLIETALLIYTGVDACIEMAERKEQWWAQDLYLESASFANYLSWKILSDVLESYIPKYIGFEVLKSSTRNALKMMYIKYIREGDIELEFDDEGNISGEKWLPPQEFIWGGTKLNLLTDRKWQWH